MEKAGKALGTAYAYVEERPSGRTWVAGDGFTLADGAAAPSLSYADWVYRIGPEFPHLRTYRSRLLTRPSFARAVDEARPSRASFPLGAPDHD